MSRTADQSDPALRQLARLHGVQSGYVDMAGRRQRASSESLLAVLRTLGVPVERMKDVPGALRETRHAVAHRVLEPIHAVWAGKRSNIPLQLAGRAARGFLRCEWRLESGEVHRTESQLSRLPVKYPGGVKGEELITRHVPVLKRLPTGYHSLLLECGEERFVTHVFCAPEQCFQSPSACKPWGLFAPLYALHSNSSWGAGDFGDLEDFIKLVGHSGGGFVGTLPLLPAFLDRPCEPSPYSPVSRLFWNEFYLDLEQVPELAICPAARRLMQASAFQKRVLELRQEPLVDYAAQMALKRSVLELLSQSFFSKASALRQSCEQFIRKHEHLADYARFRAVHEERARTWTEWPARMRGGDLRDTDCLTSLRQYHLYAQWLAHQQMGRLSEQARQQKVDLYLDMPLGTHRDGYDAWRFQKLFAMDASGGAPPDPVFTQGQDWGFAPMNPQRSREQGHTYVRAYLRHHLRHARMLRFDHVMALHRLYWVPEGRPARHGAYVTYPSEEIYAMLSIESHRHRAVIIGENLGTVPAEVNRSLKRHGINGMFVVQYEARPQRRAALRRIPPNEVASMNTHDMPPFAAFWRGLDIADRHDLGLIKRRDLAGEYRLRERVRRSLVRWLRHRGTLTSGTPTTDAVFRAIVKHLGRSDARWVLLNLEDLWSETASQNTPGTATERVNWRRKARFVLEHLRPWLETFILDFPRARR